MDNIAFLQYINAKIVQSSDDDRYYVYIGAIYGYDIEHGYDDGIYFLIDKDLCDNEYSIEQILTEHDFENPYVLTNVNAYCDNSVDIDLYRLKNDLLEYQFSETELRMFYSTFMKEIQKWGNFENENINTIKNQIYVKVIDYYANLQNDCALVNINLILKSNAYFSNQTSYVGSCNCNQIKTDPYSNYVNNQFDCLQQYESAMYMYLKQMLGDKDFYYDFFYRDGKVITELIDILIELIEEFKSMGFNISFNTAMNHCNCAQIYPDDSMCNYATIDMYVRVLNWVNMCQIDQNINKIKIYGEQFGEILPKLIF